MANDTSSGPLTLGMAVYYGAWWNCYSTMKIQPNIFLHHYKTAKLQSNALYSELGRVLDTDRIYEEMILVFRGNLTVTMSDLIRSKTIFVFHTLVQINITFILLYFAVLCMVSSAI